MPLHARQKRDLFFAWLPAALGVLVICIESTDYLSSANTLDWLRRIWHLFFGAASDANWTADNYMLRKTGHFVGYGILGLLFYRGWRHSGHILSIRRPRIVDAVFSFACTLSIACADEYHQSFLASRTSRPQDVFIDISGAVIFLVLSQLWLLTRGRRMQNPPLS